MAIITCKCDTYNQSIEIVENPHGLSVIGKYTITNANPLRGIIRMPTSDTGRTFYDMSLIYNETRPVLKIGTPVNQTGVYGPNYAMVLL